MIARFMFFYKPGVRRGRGGRSPARGGVGGEEPGLDAWKATASRRWPAALLSGGDAALPGSRGSREGGRWKMKAGPFCNF